MIRRFVTGVALAAGLTLSLSGCSGESGEKADQAGGEKPELSAAQVLEKAAEKAGAVDTFQADLALSATGTPDGDVKQNGTMKYRLKPDRAFAMSFDDMSVGGRKLTGGEQRLIGQNMYVKLPAAADGGGVQTAKPWVRMSLDDIGKQPGLGLEKLLQESREMDPVQNTLLLTASKDVKKAGEETVDGVETTPCSLNAMRFCCAKATSPPSPPSGPSACTSYWFTIRRIRCRISSRLCVWRSCPSTVLTRS